MFSRKRSSIRANTEIFWLKIHFRIPYKLKWSVQNILPGEERNTEKHNPWAGPSSPNSFKREKVRGVLGEEIYLSGRAKFEGSHLLASSNHLWRLFHVKETATPSKSHNGSWRLAYVSSLHKMRFINIYIIFCIFQEAPHHHECLALLHSLCLKNAKK